MKSKSGLIISGVLGALVMTFAVAQVMRTDREPPRKERSQSQKKAPKDKRVSKATSNTRSEDEPSKPKKARKPLPPAEPPRPPPGSDVPLDEARVTFAKMMADLRTRAESEGRMDQQEWTKTYVETMDALAPLQFHLPPESTEVGAAQRERMEVLHLLEPRVEVQPP